MLGGSEVLEGRLKGALQNLCEVRGDDDDDYDDDDDDDDDDDHEND